MKTYVLSYLLAAAAFFRLSLSTQISRNNVRVVERDNDCQTNPAWQPTQAAWIADNTDANAAAWWGNITSKTHENFDQELGKDFGASYTGFKCGIGQQSTCILPSCLDYQIAASPSWAYQLMMSLVNLDTFFNSLDSGITKGQLNYLGLTGDMAETFFPWKNPTFILGDAAFWIVAILTTLFAAPVDAEVGILAIGASAFVGAGVQAVTYSLQPDAIASQMTQSQGLADLDKFATTVGTAARQGIETWANTTVSGGVDRLNKNILDYFHNGSFESDQALPTPSQIEMFWTAQMVSRRINAQWKTEKVFVMFTQTNDSNDASGPSQARYYSAADGGVYYLYRYQEDGVLSGHLDKPWGLDRLNTSTYGITGNDIVKASARAFRTGGFNYTQDMATQRIMSSLSSNGTLTPFLDGAGWEGTWTLPVCDTGIYNFNTQYGNHSRRWGSLPCCCGTYCQNTTKFVSAANMENFQTLLQGCASQLKNTDIDFRTIDYGMDWNHAFRYKWAAWNLGIKAGVGAGLVVAGVLGLIMVILGCVGICAAGL